MTGKSCLKIIAAALLIILLLWSAAVVIIPRVLDLDSYKPRILALLEKSLHRQVSYETASFSRLLTPAFVIKGLVIKDKSGDSDLLTIDRLTFRLALLPLFHREVRLKGIVLERPVFSLARDQAGVFSCSDLFAGEPSAYELHVSGIQIRNGLVRFDDHLSAVGPLTTTLDKLDLQLDGLTRGGTTEFKLSTVVQGDGEGALISLAGTAGIPARETPFWETKLAAALSVNNLDAGRYWPYYGRFLPFERIQGRLDVAGMTFKGSLKEFATKGSLSLKALRFTYPGVFRSRLTPKQVDLDFDLELTDRTLLAKGADLRLDGLQVKGSGSLADIHGSDPHLKVRFSSSTFRFEDFQGYIPYGIIPEGTAGFIEEHIKGGTFRVNEGVLDGRISQLAHMDQATNYNALFIRATVDNGVMAFGPQVPLISAIKGVLEFRGKDFILSGLTGRFGGSPFSLDGKIADYPLATPASYPFTLSMTPTQAEVAWLLRQEKPGQLTFSGPSQLRLTGSGIAADYRLSGSWDLSRADYGFAQKLRKTAGLTNRVSFSAIMGSAEARLSELHYQLPSLDVTANGVYRYDDRLPLSLAAATNRFEVDTIMPVLPGLAAYQPHGRLQATVTASGAPGAAEGLQWQGEVKLEGCSLRPSEQLPPLNDLNGMLNLSGAGVESSQLSGTLGSSQFTATVSLRGFTRPVVDLEVASPSLHLNDLGLISSGEVPVLKNFAAKAALQDGSLSVSSLTGELNRTSFSIQGELHDFNNPKIDLRVQSPFLRVEDLLLLSGVQPGGEGGGKPGISVLKLQVEVAAGTVREIPFTHLAAALSLQNSHLAVQTVNLGIFGGTLSGSGTVALASADGPAYQAKYRLERVDAAQLLKGTGSDQSVTGLLTAAGEVTMRGTSPDELKKSAAVTARLHLQDGTIRNTGKTGEKTPYSVIDADLAFTNGIFTVQGLNAGIFGGTVSGSGTAELVSADGPAYQATYRLERVDAAQLLKAVGAAPSVTGQLTAAGGLTARGSNPEELLKTARMTGDLELAGGSLVIAADGDAKGRTVPFKAVQGRLSFENRLLAARSVRIDIFEGTVFANGSADFSVPGEPGYEVSLQVQSVESAGVDEAFGFRSDISGRLNLDAELTARGGSPDALRKSAHGSFEIHFWNGVINKFGFVSKVFSILNVSQLFALRLPDMVSTGMPYDSIDGSFSFKDGIFSTSDLVLDSPSINMTVVGKTDIVKQEIDLLCAVQPLQTISMIISRIPVFGWLLTGGDKSFLVTYYEAKGKWNDPTVTGRNMASLPGGVHNIFKRVYNLPENMITNTGNVFLGN